MGAKGAALAKQFEVKAREALATLERLSETDWKKVTEAEKWSMGVTAHHLASTLDPISNMIKAVAAGQSVSSFRLDELDEMNARHAKDYAGCTKAETTELLERNAAVAVATVRALSDDQLAKSATLFAGAPAMTAEQIITSGLLNHIDEHFGSITKTVGLAGEGKEAHS
jgi:hypothetical protein